MVVREPEQAWLDCSKNLGAELGSRYYVIWQNVANLHHQVCVYEQLFYKSEKRVDLLNEASSDFFNIVQYSVAHSIILGITRILEKRKTSGRENLTLHSLTEFAPANVKNEFAATLNKARNQAEDLKVWRDKLLAHSCIQVALKINGYQLPPIQLNKIKEVLQLISKTLDLISPTSFIDDLDSGAIEHLCSLLQHGLHAWNQHLYQLEHSLDDPGPFAIE